MSREDNDRYFLVTLTLKRTVRNHRMVWMAVATRYGVEIATATAYWPADAVNGCLYDVDCWLKKNAEQETVNTRSYSAKPRKASKRERAQAVVNGKAGAGVQQDVAGGIVTGDETDTSTAQGSRHRSRKNPADP